MWWPGWDPGIEKEHLVKSKEVKENKRSEEQKDLEYVFLHGYIRSRTSDTEVHAEYQLTAERST